jgi:hypothetical protein
MLLHPPIRQPHARPAIFLILAQDNHHDLSRLVKIVNHGRQLIRRAVGEIDVGDAFY